MKYQILFLVSLACVLNAAEAVPTKVCEPGAVFMIECNNCKCNTDGTDMACTRKNCIGNEGAEADFEQNDEPAKEEHKEEEHKEEEHKGEEHKEEEHKDCENKKEQKEGEHKEEEPKEQKDDSEHCVPGETFKKDCNDCTCPPSGLKSAGACTLLACLDDEIQKD